MILIEDILQVHQFSIDKFGGGNGIRDTGSLESAIARPFQTFGDEDLYPTIFEKAAVLMRGIIADHPLGESLIVNHPFIEGNKRTGFFAMISLIEEDGYFLKSTQNEAYDFTIKISTGEIRFEEMVEWLKSNTIKAT
jgi:death on curing protein